MPNASFASIPPMMPVIITRQSQGRPAISRIASDTPQA